MPIPLLLGAAAIVTGLIGVSKMVKSSSNNSRAEELINDAKYIFDDAKQNLEAQREETNAMLETLGETRIKAWSNDMGNFVNVFRKFENIKWEGEIAKDNKANDMVENIKNIEVASVKAAEMIKAGLGSLAAGTLAGVAAYGGVGAFAAASTGTAIAGLSGVAATNATLAWLGGGSLAAGGLGVAGGAAVLGGIVAAPVLAVTGIFMASKSEENLANAEQMHAEAERAAEKMGIMTDTLLNIYNIANDYNDFILKLSNRFQLACSNMDDIFNRNFDIVSKKFFNRLKIFFGFRKLVRVNFNDLSDNEKHSIHITWLMAQTMQAILTKNILDAGGNIDNSAKKLLASAKKNNFSYKQIEG